MTKTSISWATYTHPFWTGCTKVSEGCKFCYMHRIIDKNGGNPTLVKRVSDATFNSPLLFQNGELIFVNSMSDFFHPDADGWRDDAWAVIRNCPQHIWLILTKRPERIVECLPKDWVGNYSNVMLGVSIENQENIHRMITLAEVPDAKRFISAEPLLGPLNLTITDEKGQRPIDSYKWCIIGGESGEETGPYWYRECKLDWIEDLVADLQKNAPHVNIPVKQMGSWLKKSMGLKGWHGSDPAEFPKHLQLRARPKLSA
jgi:protein gp37